MKTDKPVAEPTEADRALDLHDHAMIAASRLVMFPKTTLPEITATIEDQMSKFFEESRTSALAEARGLVEFFNQPLPVNSRTALVERCYQVQLICETIPAHENQTKTAIALSELVTAIRESGGRDETLADLKSARDGLQRLTGAIKRSDELYQQYEFMRNQLAASESRCAALAKECEEISAKLDAIYSAVDGYVDGAPDAGPVAKLANEVSLIINPPDYP